MATALRPIGHDDRLSLVEHLEELRTRLLVCVAALVVAFSFTFWQNEAILDFVNRPLEQTQDLEGGNRSQGPLEQTARFEARLGEALAATGPALRDVRRTLDELSRSAPLSPAEQTALRERAARLEEAVRRIDAAARAVPKNQRRQPVTLGPAEPFTTTISVAFYAAILLTLPVLLYQACAFVLPAFSPAERRVAIPLMLMVPALFVGGVAFGYLVVLPRAIGFLQNFNDDSFDILLQAREYYRFAILFVGAIGLLFQMPVAILGLVRLGVVTPAQLRRNRGYVILGIAVLAAVATPTPDPVTMILAMAPLIVLFELSILLASWLDRVAGPPPARREAPAPGSSSDDGDRDAV
jgi:sec-independent protein translocase protein TatC